MSDSSESNKRRKTESSSDDATEVESASAASNDAVAPADAPADAPAGEVEFAYKVGDTVLAYHGPLMYQAKILDRKQKDGAATYKIHFVNWNKRYDTWATADLLFEANRENKADAAKLLADAKRAEEALRAEKEALAERPKKTKSKAKAKPKAKAKKSDGQKGTDTVESLRRELGRVKKERDAMQKELKRIKDGVSRLV